MNFVEILSKKLYDSIRISKGLATSFVVTHDEAEEMMNSVTAFDGFNSVLSTKEWDAIDSVIALEETSPQRNQERLDTLYELLQRFPRPGPPKPVPEPLSAVEELVEMAKRHTWAKVDLGLLEEAIAADKKTESEKC